MKLLHTISEIKEEVDLARRSGLVIGLVPTMGALHEGHLSLVRRARSECGYVVVSIFVNPTQFGECEDLDKYPRTLESDSGLCKDAGVDAIFAPSAAHMYPDGFDTWVEVGGLTAVLEGADRPGHFRGVATVCTKLFNIVEPQRAYFGLKDYQQLRVIQKMVADTNASLEIVPVDIVREPDGLAMSSRNAYLSPEDRHAAVVLHRALSEASDAFNCGETDARAIQRLLENTINSEPRASLIYAVVVDAVTLLPIERLDRPARALLAVRIGSTRLIDNAALG